MEKASTRIAILRCYHVCSKENGTKSLLGPRCLRRKCFLERAELPRKCALAVSCHSALPTRCLRPTINCQKHHRCPSGAARLCESRGTSTMWKNRSTKIEFVSLGSGLMCPHLHGENPWTPAENMSQKVVRVAANQSSTKPDSTAESLTSHRSLQYIVVLPTTELWTTSNPKLSVDTCWIPTCQPYPAGLHESLN